MLRLVWQVVYLGFLQLCTGQDLPCNVTQVASQTLYNYSIPKFSATNCDYQWTNSTDNVLANQNGKKDELVVMKSNRTLLTNECFALIRYKRNCISEGTLREANCTTNCIGNVGPQSGGGIFHNHWIAVPVVIILLLVGLFLF